MAKARPIIGLNAQASTYKNARSVVKVRLDELYNWASFVDEPYRVRKLHNLRIAAKRLRYTLEIFEEVLPEASKDAVKELTQIQDELGALHDSDVMIALLRLCLGSQDTGTSYELVLSDSQDSKGSIDLNPELVATLVDPSAAPSAKERYGLEQLVLRLQQQRDEQYIAFREHWYQLQARDFHRELLRLLDT
ncbi:MAG: CHAD domain-containing protein [Chloroflexi bacterium]|nr:CHAD domain-containing protein [Ktedonobacteraceae bacterium]MBV8821617.1 CHAD domain-containing protein [Ktedonobacteraceae bacterium]MBV9021732.1 CHAD domain-containing protein [Ktedonobacteraceae bacterium]MBV9707881.1 CHAD domain-containing protein [Chloroflexota bacterium]